MKNSNKTLSSVAVAALPSDTSVPVATLPSDTATAVAPLAVATADAVKCPYGFGRSSETSYLAARLVEGTRTRKELEAEFLANYANPSDKADVSAKKTTFSVFLSDVRRPFGTYHASRGFEITVSEDGRLSVTPESAAKAREAISKGILAALRGSRKNPSERASVLRTFGYTPEPSKK